MSGGDANGWRDAVRDFFRRAVGWVMTDPLPAETSEGLIALRSSVRYVERRGVAGDVVLCAGEGGDIESLAAHAGSLAGGARRFLCFAASVVAAPPPGAVEIHVGSFEEVMTRLIPGSCTKVAVLRVSGAAPEAVRRILEITCPALQNGSVVLLDDWLAAAPDDSGGQGIAAVLAGFMGRHPEWRATLDRRYGVCGQSFVMARR